MEVTGETERTGREGIEEEPHARRAILASTWNADRRDCFDVVRCLRLLRMKKNRVALGSSLFTEKSARRPAKADKGANFGQPAAHLRAVTQQQQLTAARRPRARFLAAP